MLDCFGHHEGPGGYHLLNTLNFIDQQLLLLQVRINKQLSFTFSMMHIFVELSILSQFYAQYTNIRL